MKLPFDADDVVAFREFESEAGQVQLWLRHPLPRPNGAIDRCPNRVCRYSVAVPSGETTQRTTAGLDSVRALLLASAAAERDLACADSGTPEHRPPVCWLDNDDLGLTINHFE